MISPSPKEWVIGLYAYPDAAQTNKSFANFYFAVIEILAGFDLSMTHIAAEGSGYSGKLMGCGSTAERRIIESGFSDITGFAITVSPKDSKEPAYDRIFSASLSWNSPNELLMCLVVNESVTGFQSESFELALRKFIKMEPWSFGLAFTDLVVKQPDFHVLSLDNGRLSKIEQKALTKWYATRPLERQRKIRNVYPVTIINDHQLGFVLDSLTLGEFIRTVPGTTVERVGALTVWIVPQDNLEALRAELGGKGALIAQN